MLASFPNKHIDDVAECDAAEDKVAPLVASPDEWASETGNDHDPVNEDDVVDRRPGHASSEKQVGK
jgi:hypothetical protein